MFSELTEQLRARDQQGLRRVRQVLEGPQAAHITIDDREYLRGQIIQVEVERRL